MPRLHECAHDSTSTPQPRRCIRSRVLWNPRPMRVASAIAGKQHNDPPDRRCDPGRPPTCATAALIGYALFALVTRAAVEQINRSFIERLTRADLTPDDPCNDGLALNLEDPLGGGCHRLLVLSQEAVEFGEELPIRILACICPQTVSRQRVGECRPISVPGEPWPQPKKSPPLSAGRIAPSGSACRSETSRSCSRRRGWPTGP